MLAHWLFPFTTDSVIYVSTAENISHFKGLVFSNFFVQPAIPDSLPTIFEPPGYPILIAALKFFGINAYTASLVWPRIGFLFLPFLFFIVFRKLMPSIVAWVASFVCTFMFPVVKCSLMAWTDVPYLCFSLISLAMVFHIIEKRTKVPIFFIFLTGIITGYAFLIRYVGLPLNLSIGIGLIGAFVIGLINFKDFLTTTAVYVLGVFLVVAPYVIRNLIVFGRIQPLSMRPSKISLQVSLHDYFRSLAEMVFTNRIFEGVVFILMAGLIAGFVLFAWNTVKHEKTVFIYALILLVYFVLDSVFLIGFKTIYLTPESIDERFLIQLAWIFMGGLVYAVHAVLKRLNAFVALDIKSITALILFAFVLVQVFPAVDFYYTQKTIKKVSEKIEQYAPLVQRLPKDCVIVSNVAEITYYFAKRNVRMLGNYTPYGLLKVFGTKRRFVVFIIKEDEFLSPAWEYPRMWQNPQGYYKFFSDKNVDLFIPLPLGYILRGAGHVPVIIEP